MFYIVHINTYKLSIRHNIHSSVSNFFKRALISLLPLNNFFLNKQLQYSSNTEQSET